VQRGEPLPVQPLLDAGDALVVDIDVADLVRDCRAVGIDALVLGEEADAGNAEPVNLMLLGRRITAVRSSTASSTSMILRGSANSDGALMSVARMMPLRSRISGRAVAMASWPTLRRAPWPSLTEANITSRSAITP
jgi:hypothetical protein